MKINPLTVVESCFLGAGVLWLATAVLGEGPAQLALPGLLNLLTGGLLLKRRPKWLRTLLVATGFYNIAIFSYQAYASYFLLTIGLTLFGAVGLAGYTAAALLFLLLAFYSHVKLGEEASAPSQP